MADGAHLGDDVGGLAEVEGGGRHALEVAVDVRVVVLAHDAEDFVAQGEAVGIEFLGVFFAAFFEEVAGGGVELEHQAFLPAAPGVGRGAVGIDVGEKQQRVEIRAVFDDGGELGDDFRVVEIAGGGGAPEGEVVVHQEHDQRAAGALDLEAVAEARGEHGRAVDVLADVFGAAGVVEDQGEIERVGVLDFVEQAPVDLAARVGFRR